MDLNIHKWRIRRTLVDRREIAETVGRPEETEDELRHLLRTMSP